MKVHFALATALALAALAPAAAADFCLGPSCASQSLSRSGEGSCAEGEPYYVQTSDWRVDSGVGGTTTTVYAYNGCAAYDDGASEWTWSWLYVNAAVISGGQMLAYGNVAWSGGDGAAAHCSIGYYQWAVIGGSSGYGRACNVLDVNPAPPVLLPAVLP